MRKVRKLKRNLNLIIWRFFVWIFLFLAIGRISYLLSVSLINYIFNEGTVIVPNLTGTEFYKAETILKAYNIDVVKAGERYNSFYEKGLIVSQQPFPGSKIKKGRKIRVYISKGPSLIRLPLLKNKSLLRAETRIRNLGLKIDQYCYYYDDEIPKDHIISTMPESGKLISSDESISLLISKGRKIKLLLVPDLVGLDLKRAMEIASSFRIIKHYEFNESIEKGKIFRQVPDAKSLLAFNSPINIWVNEEIIPIKGKRRYEIVRYTVPLENPEYSLRMVLTDEEGIREVFNRIVKAGEDIEYSISGRGKMKVLVFLNNSLVKEIKF